MEDESVIWKKIIDYVEEHFKKKPDMNAILFLIGIRELGQLPQDTYKKSEKVDLMHIAICKVLSYSGHYQLIGSDIDGWPHWELLKPLPQFDVFEQESYIRTHIIEYFLTEEIL